MVVSGVWADFRRHRRGNPFVRTNQKLAAFTYVRGVFHDWVCLLMVGGGILNDLQRVCGAAFGVWSLPIRSG